MRRNWLSSVVALALAMAMPLAWQELVLSAESNTPPPGWTEPQPFRLVLTVDARGRRRSHSPVAVELDLSALLGEGRCIDESTLFVIALDASGRPRVFDSSRPTADQPRLPHRLDQLFGSDRSTLNFVMPDEASQTYLVYFAVEETGKKQVGEIADHPFRGLIGDGDLFREVAQRRAIAASHFDQFVDFDGDGDLDLFQGGVEPYVICWENVRDNRLVLRGRLANGGVLFRLPASDQNRSWMTVAFHDIDGDGDQDFLPSFNDGPDSGRIVYYRNVTEPGTKRLQFQRMGPLTTISGEQLAGGAQAGGWFPSITFVRNWDGAPDGQLDALVGSNHRCWLYHGLGMKENGQPKFASAVPLLADGKELELTNPRFAVADIDNDGDLDLFAGTQPGTVWWFENIGTRENPALAAAQPVAWTGRYLIGDAHSGATIADFDGDGLLEIVSGRFWERTDLDQPEQPRVFGGFFRNAGSKSEPRFRLNSQAGPCTESFPICDAVRQNCVRAFDWDQDGKTDLLAGDTDGFIWWFHNQGSRHFSLFDRPEKLRAGSGLLNLAGQGGHARLEVCDWDRDGRPDLVVADGNGTLNWFRNEENGRPPKLAEGKPLLQSDGKPIRGAARASVVVADWDRDQLLDIVFADEKGYRWYRNSRDSGGLSGPLPISFGGQSVRYVRPNLGAFVDWDGDGKPDLIGCHFENSIRLYRNLGPDQSGSEPQFASPEGEHLLTASSPQIISGADVVDWNGDGDLDVLTGQGHGGSGLRFYERDWIEDERNGTHPIVTGIRLETKSGR